MRRTMLSAVAVLLVVFAAPYSFSLPPGGGYGEDIINNYYSDNSFSYAVGWDERFCEGYFGSSGAQTNWRYHEVYTCDGVQESADCEEYQPGVGWVTVACPDETVTAEGRVHITVGRS